jgi:hypothetical protein
MDMRGKEIAVATPIARYPNGAAIQKTLDLDLPGRINAEQ